MRPLILILAIGILTPLLSTALFFAWRPETQLNAGELLPASTVPKHWRNETGQTPATVWRGQWVLLFAGGGACDENCRKRLCQMRQLRLMLPGHYYRLRRVWLITDDRPPPSSLMQESHCGEAVAEQHDARTVETLDDVEQWFGSVADLPAKDGGDLYLIDPAGIWVMRFPAEVGLYRIRRDLSRLFRLSKGRKTIQR